MKKLSASHHASIHRMICEGCSHKVIALKLGINASTVDAYAKRPLPVGHSSAWSAHAGLPAGIKSKPLSVSVSTPGNWLVISDLHIPYHDEATILAAVTEAKRRRVVGVILNGDVLDCYQMSRFDKDPSKPKMIAEINAAKAVFAWLRKRLPNARIVWKEGNHEERLYAYLAANAAALFGLDVLQWPTLLDLKPLRIEHVSDKKRIDLGKLVIVHGHEFFKGFAPPVNAARGLYLKAKTSALCGHHHQTTNSIERDVKEREIATWSVGCCCQLSPDYARFSNWNNGFAFVELGADGSYAVDNIRFRNGRVEG